ncbi:MAG: N-acetylglucosamine-6-phosphate deacetylase [Balneolaceae bacterium]
MKIQDRREFLKNLGSLSLAAGTGNIALTSASGGQIPAVKGDLSNPRKKIFNGRILTPFRTLHSGTVVISGEKIVEIKEGNADVPDALEIDAGGKFIAPGFMDLHVHGGGGHDLLDSSVEAFLGMAEAHVQHGTTSMYPSAASGDLNELMRILELYEQADKQNTKGAQFLGMFLEGPYYSMEQRGAQDPRYVRDPDPAEYQDLLSRTSVIKRWDSAPERQGALEFAEYLLSQGVMPSMGHTSAIYEEVVVAFEHGYTLATHLYSGMMGVTRRDAFRYAGAVEAAFLIDEMNVEVCSDNRHLPPPLLKLIYKIKGADRIALITDSMRAAGMPDGEYIKGNREKGRIVIVENGVAMLPDRTSFAGSVATADRLVRVMRDEAGVPLADAVRMMSATPASIMGVDDEKGSLVKGKDADIVIFDEEIRIDKTLVKGKLIYDRQMAGST